jgi:PAS domain S-box-containing protein
MKADEKVNILMVDDQPAKLLSYDVILSDLGENLIKASSGTEALDILLKNDIAVVLMDVSMPDLDGFELADMIRQHPRFQKTAIIFISGVHLTDSDKINGYRRGAVDYIQVPVVPEVLRAKVSVFADLHRKTRMLERINTELERRVEERTLELRESESQFRTLANSIPQLAWMAHADGAIFWYNDRWYQYTGLSPEELKDFGWRKVQHPQHVNRIDDGLKRCRKSGELWEDTFPLLAKDGEYRWFLTRAVPILDSQGNIARWFGTATDISRQIAAEDEIRVLNQQLQQRVSELETLMQVLPVGIAMAHDAEGVSITGNAAFSQLFGTDLDAAVGKSNGSAKPGPGIYAGRKRLKQTELPLQQAATSGKPVGATEIRVVLPGGETKQILASASPLLDESGKTRGSVGAFFDVTDRKRLEDELRQRAELLELASEAVVIRDMDGNIRFWNSGAESVYGWSREDVIGRKMHEVLQTSFPIPFPEIEAALLKAKCWAGNLYQRSKDGREITVACRKSYNREANVVLEINRDISAQLKAEEALRENEKLAAMGRVAGIIAHEINNPLEAITNAFFLLRDHPSLDSEARHFARLAEQELQRVSHITKQTLGFYRESRQPIPISISEMLDDVTELQARKLQALKISLEKEYLVPGMIQGFPVELRQVFLNLFSNAVQAIGNGGKVRLRVYEGTDWDTHRRGVCIAIVDTGPGIRPEDADKLFKPFFSTKSAKGTGLGLWISQGIIQKYEGKITFRTSTASGRTATCFRIFLPVGSMEQARIANAVEGTASREEALKTTNGAD